MSKKFYFEQVEACCKNVSRFKKRISRFSDTICKCGGNGYAFADELSFLLNADPITQLDDMIRRIKKLEELTGVEFPYC